MEANREGEDVAESNRELSTVLSQDEAGNIHHHNQKSILQLLATAPAAFEGIQQANQDEFDNISSMSKKGVLWQQQNYDKFHQRLFSRWKKRYFILTTDYLVCFKKSSSKVGRSEMGKFLYKIALSDVTKIEWLRPKKSDKGAIVLHLSRPYNLLLWAKKNLDEWMFMIDESIQRNKLRRSFIAQNGSNSSQKKKSRDDKDGQNAPISKQSKCNIPKDRNLLKTAQPPIGIATINQDKADDKLITTHDELYENATAIDRELEQHQLPKLADANTKQELNNNDTLLLSSNDPVIKSQTITKYSKTNSNQSSSSRERPSPVTADASPNKQQRSQQNSLTHEKRRISNDSGDLDNEGEKSQKECEDESDTPQTTRMAQGSSVDDSIKHEKGKGTTTVAAEEALKSNDDQAGGRGRAVIYDPSNSGDWCSGGNDDNGSNATSSSATDARSNRPEMPPDAETSPKHSGERKKYPKRGGSAANGRETSTAMQDSPSRQSKIPDKLQQETNKSKKKANKKSKSSLVKNKDQAKTGDSSTAASPKAVDHHQHHHEPNEADNEGLARETVQSNERKKDKFKEEKKCNISEQDSGNAQELSHQQQAEVSQAENKVILHQRRGEEPHNNRNTNLIRRDDSWQSLVSLTRVGKVTPAMQVAQRSLYAQHIMPDDERFPLVRGDKQFSGYHQNRISAIESTVTPCRVSLSASSYKQQQQQPISSPAGPVNQRRFRPLPPLAGQLPHAPASFDVSPPNSPGPTNQQRSGSVSYQQKLFQLQLMHHNNNLDYIRRGEADGGSRSNDYGIYDASASQLYGYGYSSMRSQLKSAASEFSFIRPSSSSTTAAEATTNPALVQSSQAQANFLLHPQAYNHHQSTLPHNHHHHHHQQQQPYVLHSPNTRGQAPLKQQQQQLILSNSSLGVGPSSMQVANAINESDNNNDLIGNDKCLSPLAKQYLVHPVTGERIINQQNGQLLMAPMRELPLKPNKRRGAAEGLQEGGASGGRTGQAAGKNSSLTASIACFFRRAFSRRSKSRTAKKRAQKSKLAESSSSLGAFGDDAPAAYPPLVPSAFSTGSKSVNGQQNQQRMVDMIEAFTNQTRISQQQYQQQQQQVKATPQKLNSARDNLNFNLEVSTDGTPKQQRRGQAPAFSRRQQHHFGGSPLHKSNSISATMGLSHAHHGNDLSADNRGQSQLYDGPLIAANGSPMMMRSNKVLSANLTPLFSRGAGHLDEATCKDSSQQRLFLSPRNGHLPRPSSIYGQPSMISSPVFAARDTDRSQFGAHRNSFHNQHFRDRNTGAEDSRRLYALQMHQFSLDTTREVNEDISSPVTNEAPPVLAMGDIMQDPQERSEETQRAHQLKQQLSSVRRADNLLASSPSSGKLYQRHKAVVNPILQSPTMSTIYDNHPIVMRNNIDGDRGHYDNHNQLRASEEVQTQSPSLFRSSGKPQLRTPSHQQRSVFETNERALSMLINNGNHKKPSAIVAPTTPVHGNYGTSNLANNHMISDSPKPRGDLYPHGSPIIQQRTSASRSPMLSRRVLSNAASHHYQQSPLVSQQTRISSRGEGVQATMPVNAQRDMNAWPQPVVNIAGAPGINLDPTLAASLLKGTNIEAYESSTFDRNSLSSGHSNNLSGANKPKTFLVSTRLSKSMAYNSQSSNSNDLDAGSMSSMLRDELSSSGSRSINSSLGEPNSNGRSASGRKSSHVSTTSSGAQVDDQAESSGSDTRGGEPKSVITVKNRSKESKQGGASSIGSEPSVGELSISQVNDENNDDDDDDDDNDDLDDGLGSKRNWITSKLTATNGTSNG